MKRGQKFEDNFRNSIDRGSSDLFFYRFKDGTANWNPTEKTRFQAHNICDCMIFYGQNLFLLELKSHKGKSLPFNCIRDSQWEEMYEAGHKKNVYPFLIVFFSDINECYAVHIRDIWAYKSNAERKSIPLLFCKEKGFKIDSRLLRTNYKYEVRDFLDKFSKWLTFSNNYSTIKV